MQIEGWPLFPVLPLAVLLENDIKTIRDSPNVDEEHSTTWRVDTVAERAGYRFLRSSGASKLVNGL